MMKYFPKVNVRKLVYMFLLLGMIISSCKQRNSQIVKTVSSTNLESVRFENDDSFIVIDSSISEGSEPIFYSYEEMPEYVGGEKALLKYLNENIWYPQSAIDDSIQGRLYMSFVILEDGSVGYVRAIRGLRYDLEDVCIEVMQEMPDWKPGKLRRKPARVSFTIPIVFSLDTEKDSKGVTIYPKKESSNGVKIKLYPNPARESFYVELSETANDVKCQLITLQGQMLKTSQLNSSPAKIDISDFNTGTYLVRIISIKLNLNRTEKLIVRK